MTLQDSLNESSFNENSPNEGKTSNVLFIAEGVETALSIKTRGLQGTIKVRLGLSNAKRIVPDTPDTPIVICAGHDTPDFPAARNLEKSVNALQEKGYSVTVIKPDQVGDDFNDVLKKQGPQGVKENLEKNLQEFKLPKELTKSIQPTREALRPNSTAEEETRAESGSSLTPEPRPDEKDFQHLVQHCEKRLYNLLEKNGPPLTSEH